ncbi:MAG TPA: RNA methyltransferase, partial [Verrucomicrobiaceae bacterium]
MKLPRIVIAEIITALLDVFVQGKHADKVIERAFKAHKKWGARDRRLFAESVYDIVRWWRWHWHLAGLPDVECLDKSEITEARLWQVWGAYWIERESERPPFVECAMLNESKVRARAEEGVAPALRASFPDWLFDLGAREFGSGWSRIADSLNQAAPVDLRVNTLRISSRDLQEALHREGIEAGPLRGIPDALRLRERK